MIEARLEPPMPAAAPASLVAMADAAAELALLRMLLAGEAACSADALARHIIALKPRHQENEQHQQHGE